MTSVNPLPLYQCHKKVRAAKIRRIALTDGTETRLETDQGWIFVSREYVSKHKPEVGGYYVLYEDGYESFSPAKAFEEGYTRVDA